LKCVGGIEHANISKKHDFRPRKYRSVDEKTHSPYKLKQAYPHLEDIVYSPRKHRLIPQEELIPILGKRKRTEDDDRSSKKRKVSKDKSKKSSSSSQR